MDHRKVLAQWLLGELRALLWLVLHTGIRLVFFHTFLFRNRAHSLGISDPVIVCPVTAHAAFDKVGIVNIIFMYQSFKANIDPFRRLIFVEWESDMFQWTRTIEWICERWKGLLTEIPAWLVTLYTFEKFVLACWVGSKLSVRNGWSNSRNFEGKSYSFPWYK